MKKTNLLTIALLLWVAIIVAQTNNPVPDKIRPSGLIYQLEEVLEVQRSNSTNPKARINILRELPDDSGRLAIVDLRGLLWILDGEDQELLISIKNEFPKFIDAPGKGTGFGAFAFHPEFVENGKFYTSHAEQPGSGEPDFIPEVSNGAAMQWVVMEWTMEDPSSSSFNGTYREILRADYPDFLHGIQEITFNPNATPGDEDYGLLFICFGDGGSSLNFWEENIQNKGSHLGTIFRIDPLGENSANGQYGVPDSNPFVNEEGALGEIYCYGFRNPHRISWDTGGDQIMIISDIGEKNLEEINIGLKGANYGWGEREGTFEYRREAGREFVYDLPENDADLGYTYPVAQFDHDEGLAIVGGYVYRGDAFPDLYGHYIFGDIPSGRMFHVPVSEFEEGELATITTLTFVDEAGDRTTLVKETNDQRPDLRFGIDNNGEIYILTKADGKIRKMTNRTSSYDEVVNEELLHIVNPTNHLLIWESKKLSLDNMYYQFIDNQGRILKNGSLSGTMGSIDISNIAAGTYFLNCSDGKRLYTHTVVKL